jgi:hypothetical protein
MGVRLLGALMAGALVSVSAGLGEGSASAQARRDEHVSPQAWTVQKSYPPVIDDVAGLSCPNTSDCWAVGTTPSDAGAIVGSTSGGSTWTSEAAMNGLHYLRAISCPTTTSCWAVGYDTGENLGIPTFKAGVVVTTDGGKTWKRQRLPNGTSILSAVSCPTATKCWAVGDSGPLAEYDPAVVTTNSRGLWTTESVPKAVFVLWDVSCPTSQVCWAIGDTRSSQPPIVVATTRRRKHLADHDRAAEDRSGLSRRQPERRVVPYHGLLLGGLADVDDSWRGATGSCRAVGLAGNGGAATLANGSAIRANSSGRTPSSFMRAVSP